MRSVFLSASAPDPRRNPTYFTTADIVAIREAVRALASVVLPHAQLFFGGHPAITPLIRHVAERVGHRDRITIYQSEFFRPFFPKDNSFFDNMVLTAAVPNDRDASLLLMRQEMLTARQFAAGVFIGGMEGVEAEFDLFRQNQPTALWLPLGSTGAAARVLLDKEGAGLDPSLRDRLRNDLVFAPMLQQALGLGP